MGEKTAGVGHFAIPTAPAAGTSCTSGAANVFTTTYVQLIASTSAALFITGLHVEKAAASAATYCVVQLATGAAASETIIGQYLVPLSTGSTVALGYRPIYPPIPVANAARIAVKTADSVGAQAALITLECINQSNVVDDGVAVGTVTTVTNQLTGAAIATAVWQDATAGDFTTASSIGKALYIANVAPGAAGGHFIAGTNAATTITTGLTTTFTGNLTGSVASVTGAVGSVTGSVGSVTGLTASNLDAAISSRMATYTQPTGFLAATFPTTVSSYAGADTSGTTTLLGRLTSTRAGLLDNMDAAVSSRLASASYTAPDNTSVVAIKAKTDSLTFTVTGKVDAGIYHVNGITVTGAGTAGSPWGPA